MAAILALDAAVIEEVTADMDGVWIANYNCPGQIVISGETEALDKACEALQAAGVKRVIKLNVSGPFHSKMLEPAGEKLYAYLRDVEIAEDFLPYVCNADACYVTDASEVKTLLMRQVYSSVRWQQSIEAMIADGVDTFVEVGPGKTLSGFMRKINKEMKCINIATVDDLKKLEELNA